jgi:hypothetical protein
VQRVDAGEGSRSVIAGYQHLVPDPGDRWHNLTSANVTGGH